MAFTRALVAAGASIGLLAPSPAVAASSVYASNWAEGTVSRFTIGANGTLTGQGVPVDVGSTPSGVVISPDGNDLYVASSGSGTISAFSIGAGGALTAVGAPVVTGTGPNPHPYGLAISPSGENLYAANFGDGTVSTFTIGTGGALTTLGTPTPSGSTASSGPGWLAVSPGGQNLYVTNFNEGTVATFSIGAGGTLTPLGTPIASGSGRGSAFPERLAVAPNGQDLYVTNSLQGTVSTFSIGTGGALTQLGTPVASGSGAGSGPEGIAIAPNGAYLDVTNYADGTVSTFSIGTLGALAGAGSPAATGSHPFGLAISPSGHLYAANYSDGTLSTFSIGAGGALTQVGTPVTSGSGAGSQPYELAVTPDRGPTAAFSATIAPAGSPTAFSARASARGSAPITAYAWYFGDGATATGPRVRHVFARPGTYTVTLTLTAADHCSVFGPFTGHVAYCAADPAATMSRRIDVPAPPTVSRVSLAGIGAGRPRLAFTVREGAGAPPLRVVTITLPRGLTFARTPGLGPGISGTGSGDFGTGPSGRPLRFTVTVRRGALAVRFRSPTAAARIVVGSPELSASRNLVEQLGRGRAHKLTLKLRLTDSHRRSTTLEVKLTVR